MSENLAAQNLASCGLPQAWAKRAAWTVLDTDCADGQGLLSTWLTWQRDPNRPQLLHYVVIAEKAPQFKGLTSAGESGDRPNGSQVLADLCQGLGAGFHRILLDDSRVSLTLCIGEVPAMLGEHVFQADSIFSREPMDKWEVQLLVRRCKRGTRLATRMRSNASVDALPDMPVFILLQSAGFQVDDAGPSGNSSSCTFNPRWEIPTSRAKSGHVLQSPSRCAVVGAGIAGASIAQALALRGWQVTVFDQEAYPAGGASGLPAGLAVPHVSVDNNPRSRLSRSGTRLMMQHADRRLVHGQDWAHTGVMELRPGAVPLWHQQACWIKPAALVRAWLDQPGIRFVGGTKITQLRRVDGVWLLGDPQGHELGGFEIVVAANALGCSALFKDMQGNVHPGLDLQDKLAALHGVHGTLSLGLYAESIPGLPATPVNGNGCFIPSIPSAGGEQWLAGATFETDALVAADMCSQHAANMHRLRRLLPINDFDLADTLDRGPVSLWSATRCVTHDRLPLVGPIETTTGSGLWLCAGMGSRGLSLSALCAELLVARLGGEPLPMEYSLSRSLDVNRARRKH